MNQPPISRDTAAQMKMETEMHKRTSKSIYGRDGKLNAQAARDLSQGHTYLAEYLDLSIIPFAPEPDGSEHATNLARLVEYMAQLTPSWGGVVGGPLELHDQKVLYAVAMLYAVGRTQGRERYEERSAAFAEQFFLNGGGAGTYWSKVSVREETCRLIYRHTNEGEISRDKRLQVFADAVRYETARFLPNTSEGMALLKEHCVPDKFHSGWAKDKANFRAWMKARGWK